MLTEHQKFKLFDVDKKNDFYAEVNWEGLDHPQTGQCSMVRFTFPDGTQAIVKQSDLHGMIFAMGTRNQQADLVPVTTKSVRTHAGLWTITAKKDIHKGEEIAFRGSIDCDVVREDTHVGRTRTKTSFLLPRGA